MALAVVAATAAAWWPARSLTRQPIMAALSRRPTPSSSVKRTTAGAGAFVLVGMVAVAASRPTADDVRPVVLVVGLVALVVGVVLSTPFALRALAAPAGRLPLAARMAVRDLVRHQSRAGAALAAITLGLAVSMAVTVLAKANEYRSDEGNLSDRQLVVRTVRQGPEEGGPSEADRAGLDAAAARVGALLPGAASYPLDVVMDPAAMEGGREPVTVARQTSPHSYRFVDDVYVATPELLRHFGIDDADVTDGAELLTAASGEVFLFDPRSRPDPAAKEHVAHVVLSPFDSAPRSLVLPSAVEAHGWTTIRSGWFIEAPGALTPKQLAAARRAAADLGVAVEARSTQDDLATLRTIATSVGVLLALAIIGMTIGLLRSESAADLRTLTATGATSRTRRALTANTAASLAVLGVVLGTGGAYAALIAAYRSDLTKLTSPPLAQLAAAVIGIPVLAAVGGWLVAGREPATFSRSALD
jgi:putative ABC transport system permease protein